MDEYREYLESRYLDEFEAWSATFVNPFTDLAQPDANRNWDLERRRKELLSDGVVGEVLFPNTIPPFFPSNALVAPQPRAADVELRVAGLLAHNRWLADFCSRDPQRLAGVAQIVLTDVDAAVADIHWAKDAGLRGGILLPGAPEDSAVDPLYSPVYEPIWAACEELGMPLNTHAGGASPAIPGFDAATAVWVFEAHWWAHRTLWHLIFSGALDRHPDLTLVFTEQGTGWVPGMLKGLDSSFGRLSDPTSALARFGGPAGVLPLKPSEYWARQCYVGASFLRPNECVLRDEVGLDKIMWGSDYPHLEGTYPYTLEALRYSFSGVSREEVAMMLAGNAAKVYGFDIDALAPIAAEVGPKVCDVATPLDSIPDSPSSIWAPEPIKSW
jgi:predicted TIM-barrel fold metal-dependent hydrolase